MKVFVCLFCWLLSATVYSQTDSSRVSTTLNALADGYYVYSPERKDKEIFYPFLYNYNRNRDLQFNHAWVKLSVLSPKVRTNLALHTGTYVQDNYAEEPNLAKILLEANIGFALNDSRTIWLDAGIIPSHIGFEGAGTLTNWTLTRSLIAEGSPYYLNGIKLTWIPNPKWEFTLLGFNGWQRIYQSGKVVPAGGWQIKHQRGRSLVNWSTYIGDVQVELNTQYRFFHNLYYQVELAPNFYLLADVDVGIQRAGSYQGWWGAALLARYEINKLLSATCRAEYYADKQGLVIDPPGFVIHSFSFNADYKPIESMLIRTEFRRLISQQPLDASESDVSAVSYFTLAALVQVNFYKSDK